MYADEEIKRGTPIRNFLIGLMLVIVFVLLLLWLLPLRTNNSRDTDSNTSDGTNIVFNANIQEMKQAGLEYYTVDRLPKKVGSESKITLKQMVDKNLLSEFVDKNGNTCDTDNSYVLVTKEEDEYIMKVYLKCNDDEDYILTYIGQYSYCSTDNGICEKQETIDDKTIITTKTKTKTKTKKTLGPKCILEIDYGKNGNNGWYTSSVNIKFKSKNTTSNGAKIVKYGIGTSSSVNYNGNNTITINNEGTTKVYGYVKDSNGKTAVCSITVKKDSIDPDCSIGVLSGTKNSSGYYVGNVMVGFVRMLDKNSGVMSYGINKKNNPNYDGKTSLTITDAGETKIYGYVKDRAGHTKVCSSTIRIVKDNTYSNPTCELSVNSGTKGNNNWYVSNVIVGFKNKSSTNGAKIISFGIGTSENYNNNKTYIISKDGIYTIKGYVKDSNGYISTCSINIKKDTAKPNCSLSVISGTKNINDEYTGNVIIGFKSKTDTTSGVNSYGIGRSLTYSNNTSYNITGEGLNRIYGYIKDNAGNTNVCSININKKSSTYEYQYYKKINAEYGDWSTWTTKEYTCNNPPDFKKNSTYESVDLGSKNVISGYTYSTGDVVTAKQIKQTGTILEKSCVGWTYYKASTNATKIYAIKVGEEWNYIGLVSLSALPTDTLSVKYVFVGMDWDRCGSTCTTTPYTLWKKYTRSVSTVTSSDTIVTGSAITKCTKYETKNTILYSTNNIVVGYEKKRTINYKKTCNYKYKSRKILKDTYIKYEWSHYNDSTLLSAGYNYTGTKRLTN